MRKVYVFSMVAFVLLSMPLSAQKANRRHQQQKGGMHSMYTPEQQAEKMAQDLNLNESQKAKLVDFYTKTKVEREALRAERAKEMEAQKERNSENRDKFRAEREARQKEHQAELELIIGKEKLAEYNKIQEERRAENRKDSQGNMPNRRGHRPGNAMK